MRTHLLIILISLTSMACMASTPAKTESAADQKQTREVTDAKIDAEQRKNFVLNNQMALFPVVTQLHDPRSFIQDYQSLDDCSTPLSNIFLKIYDKNRTYTERTKHPQRNANGDYQTLVPVEDDELCVNTYKDRLPIPLLSDNTKKQLTDNYTFAQL